MNMYFEQSLIVPYLVGCVLGLGFALGTIIGKGKMTYGSIMLEIITGFIGSWIYVGIVMSIKLDKK